MNDPSLILERIAELDNTRKAADLTVNEHLADVGHLVEAVAASEVAYEILASRGLQSAVDITTHDLADTITKQRTELNQQVERAISSVKIGLHAEHEQRVLREELVSEATLHAQGKADES